MLCTVLNLNAVLFGDSGQVEKEKWTGLPWNSGLLGIRLI